MHNNNKPTITIKLCSYELKYRASYSLGKLSTIELYFYILSWGPTSSYFYYIVHV